MKKHTLTRTAVGAAVASVTVLGLAACGSGQDTVMPQVTGLSLDVAQGNIASAGFEGEVEVLGGGALGVIDESNWQVCDQSPAAGQAITTAPQLTVDRSCGDEAAEPQPTEPAPSPTESEAAEAILTVENNEELAALLAASDDELSRAFATKYEGKLIAFDGNIAYMANHGDYDTRYDFLVTAGDYSETSQIGPSFKIEDANYSDLHLTGANIPDQIGTGDNIRIVARVREFNSNTGLFYLEPVSTEVR